MSLTKITDTLIRLSTCERYHVLYRVPVRPAAAPVPPELHGQRADVLAERLDVVEVHVVLEVLEVDCGELGVGRLNLAFSKHQTLAL